MCSKQHQCTEFVLQQQTLYTFHFRGKKEQSFKKDVKEVISTLQAIVKQQQSDEIRAIYGCGTYRLRNAYKKFEVEAQNNTIIRRTFQQPSKEC